MNNPSLDLTLPVDVRVVGFGGYPVNIVDGGRPSSAVAARQYPGGRILHFGRTHDECDAWRQGFGPDPEEQPDLKPDPYPEPNPFPGFEPDPYPERNPCER